MVGGICVKKSWKAVAFIMVIVVILSFSACRTATPTIAQQGTIIGTWQDAYGLTKYKFSDHGKMKIQALNIGSFDGKYDMQDNHITIEYNVLLKKEKNTYTYQLKDNKLYLDGKIFKRKK